MARKVYRCVKCGSWSELGVPECGHRGESEVVHVASVNNFWGQPGGRPQPSSGVVPASRRRPSPGGEGKVLLLRTDEPSPRGATWITEQIQRYEAAKARGAAAGAIRDAYNNRPRVGPITVRYSAFGPVYD